MATNSDLSSVDQYLGNCCPDTDIADPALLITRLLGWKTWFPSGSNQLAGGAAVLASLPTDLLHCVKLGIQMLLSIDWQGVHDFGKQEGHERSSNVDKTWIIVRYYDIRKSSLVCPQRLVSAFPLLFSSSFLFTPSSNGKPVLQIIHSFVLTTSSFGTHTTASNSSF